MNNQSLQSVKSLLPRHNVSTLDLRLQITAAQCMQCLDAAISTTDYCFFDLNIDEQSSQFLERVESLSPTQRLLLAMSLLGELLLLIGQRQVVAVPQPSKLTASGLERGVQ